MAYLPQWLRLDDAICARVIVRAVQQPLSDYTLLQKAWQHWPLPYQ